MLTTCLAAFAFVWRPTPITLCIDPGHPSEVGRGTHGIQSTEIQVAWQVAKALEANLKTNGFRVVMTKSAQQQFVTNRHRAEVANAAHASLMLRLHCDAGSGSGFAVYYPDRQGISNGFLGPDSRVLQRSAQAARRLHWAMATALSGYLNDNGLKIDRQTAVGARQGALTGSIFSKVPVVLVEMAVLTNPRDEAFIRSSFGQAKVVEALSKGVIAAVGSKNK